MNKLVLPCLACLLWATGVSIAQNQNSVQDVSASLEKNDVFVKYRKFRGAFEQMNVELGNKLSYAEDYSDLHVAYDEVQNRYNAFLEIIRTDLSDWQEIKKMLRRPGSYADKYLGEYNGVIGVYHDNFLPIYRRLLDESQAAKEKALPPQLIVLGVEVFSALVDLIKGRREERETNLSAVIGTVNTYFYKKLRMKAWDELGIPEPDGTRSEPDTVATYDEPVDAPADGEALHITQVSAPLFSGLSGYIEFHYLDPQGQDRKMNFAAKKGKNITVAIRKIRDGKIAKAGVTNRVDYFNSEESFAEGGQFYLKVGNSAGMYALTLNTDGTVDFLYPYDADSGELGKNIIIEGRDRDNVTLLPAPDNDARRRYFTFSGTADRESFGILLTRSELDIAETRRALESRREADLHERLAAVFSEKLVQPGEANLSLNENRLEFDASGAEATVLPVVFYIRRK